MLSRLYDERVFTNSDDVVFSASSSQALHQNGVSKSAHSTHQKIKKATERPSSGMASHRQQQQQQQRNGKEMLHSDLLDEEDESKSDGHDSMSELSADDELEETDEEDERDEARRLRGLKFPLQSPRHINASQSYLHRQRRRQLQQEAASSRLKHHELPESLSPTTRRRMAKKLLDQDAYAKSLSQSQSQYVDDSENAVMTTTTTTTKMRNTAVKNTFHDRPMELVFLPTGEIRPRDECPPGLKLPLASKYPVLQEEINSNDEEHEDEEEENEQRRPGATTHKLSKMNGKTTSKRSPQDDDESDGSDHYQHNHYVNKTTGRRHHQLARGNQEPTPTPTPADRSYRPAAIQTRENKKMTVNSKRVEYEEEQDQGEEQALEHRVHTATTRKKEHLQRQRKQQHDEQDEDNNGRGFRYEPRTNGTTTTATTSNPSLHSELQKEKKRVLDKMTQLLEEQGKTQALQHKLEMYETKIASMEHELQICAGREELLRDRDARIQSLVDELRAKDDRIARLEDAQAKALEHQTVESRSNTKSSNANDDDRVSRLRQREAALAKQLEELMNRVTSFHSQVETWKVNSRDALESCDTRTDFVELMDRLWVDFPPFIVATDRKKPSMDSESEGESSTITFLTKKLRQKDEELRMTHLKYVELKELCARQCIREADLQNFINEHRLRGNLVFRNPPAAQQQQQQQQQRGQQENQPVRANGYSFGRSAAQPDDDEYEEQDEEEEEEEEADVMVQRPRVFIDIKQSNHPHRQQQQHQQQQQAADIEHVRLEPSPGLTHRFRHQQVQQHAPHQQLRQHSVSTKQTTTKRTTTAGVAQRTTSRAATVSSASRTLGVTRSAPPSAATHKRATSTTTLHRAPAPASARSASITSRNTAARASASAPTSSSVRRPSTQPPPLTSRPWV